MEGVIGPRAPSLSTASFFRPSRQRSTRLSQLDKKRFNSVGMTAWCAYARAYPQYVMCAYLSSLVGVLHGSYSTC
jgi:hypothetical protein